MTNDKLNQCVRIEGKGKIIPGAVRVYPLPALSPTHIQERAFQIMPQDRLIDPPVQQLRKSVSNTRNSVQGAKCVFCGRSDTSTLQPWYQYSSSSISCTKHQIGSVSRGIAFTTGIL